MSVPNCFVFCFFYKPVLKYLGKSRYPNRHSRRSSYKFFKDWRTCTNMASSTEISSRKMSFVMGQKWWNWVISDWQEKLGPGHLIPITLVHDGKNRFNGIFYLKNKTNVYAKMLCAGIERQRCCCTRLLTTAPSTCGRSDVWYLSCTLFGRFFLVVVRLISSSKYALSLALPSR